MSKNIHRKTFWLAPVIFIVLLAFPLVLSRFYIYLVGLILVFGLAAMSLNLVLGYGGI
jgi:ABC-type branched-subunit amino acid transport system permease subunit